MKEATGEASMTGITIAIIAVVAAVAIPLVTTIINNTAKKACCAGYGGQLVGSNCQVTTSNGGTQNLSNWWDNTAKKCK